MKLIDADKLKDTISDTWILDRIDEQPTIKAVKVAQWIEDGYGNGEMVCSNCGEPCATFTNLKPRDRYCKWCGAKMEG